MADIDCRTLDIRVSDSLGWTQERDSLLHEINHAIMQLVGGYKQGQAKETDEEHLVSRLTSLQLQFMRDNPEVLEYLTEKEET